MLIILHFTTYFIFSHKFYISSTCVQEIQLYDATIWEVIKYTIYKILFQYTNDSLIGI